MREGAVAGILSSGSMLPKMGLKAGTEMPGGERAAAVTEILEGKESPASLVGGGPPMGFHEGSAEVAAGGADAERWRGGFLPVANKVLRVEGNAEVMAGRSGGLADLSACLVGGIRVVTVTGDVGEAGVIRVMAAVGFSSQEGPGRGSDCAHKGGAIGLAVFRDEWASLTSSPLHCGEASGPGDAS